MREMMRTTPTATAEKVRPNDLTRLNQTFFRNLISVGAAIIATDNWGLGCSVPASVKKDKALEKRLDDMIYGNICTAVSWLEERPVTSQLQRDLRNGWCLADFKPDSGRAYTHEFKKVCDVSSFMSPVFDVTCLRRHLSSMSPVFNVTCH